MAISTVHTAGINWVSVFTIVGVTITSMSIIFGFMARSLAKYVTNRITSAIDRFRIEVVDSMDKRVTTLEANAANERRTRR